MAGKAKTVIPYLILAGVIATAGGRAAVSSVAGNQIGTVGDVVTRVKEETNKAGLGGALDGLLSTPSTTVPVRAND